MDARIEEMQPCAKWTDDCQGKKDYDGRLVSISTRYWPRGGGFLVIDKGRIEEDKDRPHIKPSAKSSIVVNFGEPDDHGFADSLTLIEAEFSGNTEAEVKGKVEDWVRSIFREIVGILRDNFHEI